jgi:hypothetical protein
VLILAPIGQQYIKLPPLFVGAHAKLHEVVRLKKLVVREQSRSVMATSTRVYVLLCLPVVKTPVKHVLDGPQEVKNVAILPISL